MPIIGGLYTGLAYHDVPMSVSGAGAMDDFLESLVSENKQDSVVSIFMMPTSLFTDGNEPKSVDFYTYKPEAIGNGSGAYTPRNKKLLTYPYCFFSVDVMSDSHDYRWEWFDGDTAAFTAYASITPNPEIAIVPQDYNGSVGDNATEQVTMTGFPQVAWPVDSYMAWLAQKATGTGLQLASQAVGLAGSVATGNIAGIAGSALGMASTVNSAVVEATKGNQTRGTQSGSVNVAADHQNVYIRFMEITPEYARMIDDFFDLYGYSYGRVEVPQRNRRKQWTYVQTKGCKVFGDLPEDSRVKIQQIHDRGITYWRHPENVGNYALDNTLGSQG